MTNPLRAAILIVTATVVIGTAAFAVLRTGRNTVAVQVGRVVVQELTQSVSANGEIRPKKYVNISSNAFGRIVHLPVKEGDTVTEGQLLLRLEAVQTQADVRAAQATLEGALADSEGLEASVRSAEAFVATARAELTRSEADLNRSRLQLNRSEQLNRDGLISKEQFDRSRTDFEISNAQTAAARARVSQAEAQMAQTRKQREGVSLRIAQHEASVVRARDQLSKTTILAPLAGIITHLPVNEGEIAIVGVQNQAGTVLMTIADMSVITAEVKVDETDIVNVRVGQLARVRVDAMPDQELLGHISEVGSSALTRTGGLAATTATQEAKDFKVVVTLDEPPPTLRPGLSCTATIVTATKKAVMTVPIQALVIRDTAGPSSADPSAKQARREEQGVFAVENGMARFRAVKTGIVGTTDIELMSGLAEGEVIVTGTYQVLRTLRNDTRVRVDRPN